MNHAALKNTAQQLSEQAGFLVEITSHEEYEEALALMEELIDDYDNQLVLIELLTHSIARWEEGSLSLIHISEPTRPY